MSDGWQGRSIERVQMKSLVISVCALALTPLAHAGAGDAHWTYAGEHGPGHWAELDQTFATCAGDEQSPIDLNSSAIPAIIDLPEVHWQPADVMIAANNGRTFEVSLENPGEIIVDETPYRFRHLHFHAGSEHTINGVRYPMEAHFVHAADNGAVAIMGVLFVEGEHNPHLGKLISTLPGAIGSYNPQMVFDLGTLLPGAGAMYRYNGSLTTPPCSETVSWMVFETPLTASREQIIVFETLFPKSYRPTQDVGRRFVLRSN